MARAIRLIEVALAVEGVALFRRLFEDVPGETAARLEEVRRFVEGAETTPMTWAIEAPERIPRDGYAEWAATYDAPGNGLIDVEQPIVAELLAHISAARGLDVACGTGRLTALLSATCDEVVGVDASPAMLAVARARVPDAIFREGRIEGLPVPDAAFDVVTCGLALAHLPELAPAIAEMARAVRPGGQVVLSDIHPFAVVLGGQALYRGADDSWGFVRNFQYRHADYLGAFEAAGLRVRSCIEPAHTVDTVSSLPTYGIAPEATAIAMMGIPLALIWHLERPA